MKTNSSTSGGATPVNWIVKTWQDVCEICYGKDQKDVVDPQGAYPIYGTGGLMARAKRYLYDKPSVLIGRKGTIDKPFYIDQPFWTVDTLFYTQINKGIHPKWFYYIVDSTPLKKYNEATGVPSLSRSNLYNIKVVVPPLPEQLKIAEILTTVDEKLEVITDQIEQTQELKKGLMQRLLTKGIGHTQFKDSPLGQIPESWKIDTLSNFAKCSVGIASSATHAYSERGVLLIRNQNIKEGKLDLSDHLYVTPEYEVQHKSKRLRAGDILTVRTGYPGISAVVPKELEGSQSFTTLITRPNKEIVLSEFLCYYINSEKGKAYFNNNKAGGGQQNVGSKTLEKMPVPLPTLSEQKMIVEMVSTIYDKLEVLIEKKIQYQELKKGLMQQLLTGKLRVNHLIEQPELA